MNICVVLRVANVVLLSVSPALISKARRISQYDLDMHELNIYLLYNMIGYLVAI